MTRSDKTRHIGDDGEAHEIRAEVLGYEERRYGIRELDDGDLTLDFRDVTNWHGKRRKMFWCICDSDRKYRKEETAIDHLRDVGVLDELLDP